MELAAMVRCVRYLAWFRRRCLRRQDSLVAAACDGLPN